MPEIKLGLSYNDVLLVPRFSRVRSRNDVDLSTTIAPGIALRMPLIAANMDTVTGVEMAVALHQAGGIGLIGRFDPPEIQADKVAQVTRRGARSIGVIGVKGDFVRRAAMLLEAGSIGLHLDIAHAHSEHALEVIRACKERFPDVPIIAGTIATYEAAMDLLAAGADSLKVGIGAGSTCITRLNTGAGVPQLTAIREAARARNESYPDRFILADGGAVNSGDIVKALAAGADAYIGGSLFAGTDEAPGDIIEISGQRYKTYNGSTSPAEKLRQLEKYDNDKNEHFQLHVEGIEAMVPVKGPVRAVIESLGAGIRSGLSYAGAFTIRELHERAEFIRVTDAGNRESQPHDVTARG